MTEEVDGEGRIVLGHHARVCFQFEGVHDVRMDAFRPGNILFALELSPPREGGAFRVELESVMDMSGSFSARRGEVVSLTPGAPEGTAA